MSYLRLDPARIIVTIEKLRVRIGERFPTSNLGNVADEFLALTKRAAERVQEMRRTSPLLLAGIAVLVLCLLGAMTALGFFLPMRLEAGSAPEYLQGVEALFEIVVLLGAAIAFLLSLRTRAKRRRVLDGLHELRALAHVVDMHQLTKDPERLRRDGGSTTSSPSLDMTPRQLDRYLDYCSEMLSLIAKVAALYVQGLPDAVVLDTVDDIEDLTTGLSQKIWQKIMILDRLVTPGDREPRAVDEPGPRTGDGREPGPDPQ